MAETSKIQWTDSTVNFWWGCTKVGPGCDHCYAEKWDARTGGAHWGLGVPRRKIAGAVPLIHRLDNSYSEWAADAICAIGNAKAFGLPVPNIGTRRRVFIQSMSDLFDLEVPLEWFAEAWNHIELCDRIDIQIVTKRVSAVAKRLAEIGCTRWPQHAGLIITVCNQDEADRDIPRLLALKEKFNIPWVGLSCEPLLGPIDLTPKADDLYQNLSEWYGPNGFDPEGKQPRRDRRAGWFPKIDWVISGGESGKAARPSHPDWHRSLRDQCTASGVPFLFKQWGDWREPIGDEDYDTSKGRAGKPPAFIISRDGTVHCFGRNGDDDRPVMIQVGKKRAGRLLDGIEHNGFPECRP